MHAVVFLVTTKPLRRFPACRYILTQLPAISSVSSFERVLEVAEASQNSSVCPSLLFIDGKDERRPKIGAAVLRQFVMRFLRKRASWLSSSERRGSRWMRPSNNSSTSYRTFDPPASTASSYGQVSTAFPRTNNNQPASRD